MAIVKTYYVQLKGEAPRATWQGSSDGRRYEPLCSDDPDDADDAERIDFHLPSGTTHMAVRLENACAVPIRVRFLADGHERHGALFDLEPGGAITEFWDLRSLQDDHSLQWKFDGRYPTLNEAIHDPTFKVTKGGGG